MTAQLPRGRLLPAELWRRRHRVITTLLWLHVPALALFAIGRGYDVPHTLLELVPVLSLALLASFPGCGRLLRSASAALGLVVCSSLLVHFWNGQIEGHFHFFVVVSLLILYQDWVPFLLAVGFVVVHHGLLGMISPESVFNHPSGVEHPWAWAAIHGAFMLAASAANVVSWRATEQLLRDPLTGLAGRVILFDRLRLALKRARRSERHAGVIFLDLDRFKLLNDSLGHSVGDKLLVATGERLRDAVRVEDTAVRFGGDEFVVICEDLADPDAAVGIAARLAEVLREPYWVDGRELVMTVSVGIAVGATDDRGAEDLIRDADAAMYRAKELGKDMCVVFDEAMRGRALMRLEGESDLRSALAQEQLRLHYQPEFALGTGRVRAVEALARWQHPTRGLIGPGDFIPTAEETGLIVPLGDWVLREACRQIARWNRMAGLSELVVRVNVSARQLDDDRLMATIEGALRDSGAEPGSLCLELTETAVMTDPERSLAILGRVRELGVGLALDDFGTGHSTMSYLRELHFDVLKVDRVFVRDLGGGRDDAILRTIVDLGHALDSEVTAEGVETEAQLEVVQALGCDTVQGFLLARPGPPADIARFAAAPAQDRVSALA